MVFDNVSMWYNIYDCVLKASIKIPEVLKGGFKIIALISALILPL